MVQGQLQSFPPDTHSGACNHCKCFCRMRKKKTAKADRETHRMKENKKTILRLIPAFLVIAIGLYSFFVRLDLVVLFMGTSALFVSIGMLEPKYVRFSRFMSVFFISSAGISSYFSTGNVYIAMLALLFFLLAILQEFRSSKGTE